MQTITLTLTIDEAAIILTGLRECERHGTLADELNATSEALRDHIWQSVKRAEAEERLVVGTVEGTLATKWA